MKKTYILPLFALCLAACVDDEGNYSYSELNEVTIENIEESYNALSKVDHLKITPEIKDTFGHDLSNYEFCWTLCGGGFDEHDHTILGHEKDLDWPVDLDPGTYNVYLTITDKSTNIETMTLTYLRVAHPFTRGFLILGDLENEDRLAVDMLSMPSGLDTMMIENAIDNTQLNLRNPQRLLYSGSHYNGHEHHGQALWLMADDKAYKFDTGVTLDCISEFNQCGLFDTDYQIERPAKLRDVFPHQTTSNMSRSYRGYITDDMILMGSVIMSEYFVMPLNRYSASATTLYKPFKQVFYRARSGNNAFVFYDMDSKQFCHVWVGSYDFTYDTTISYKMTDQTGDPWSWNTATDGRNIVYGENPIRTDNYSFAIMKDASDNYYIYRFLVQTSAASNASKFLYTIDKSIATDFEQATSYMFAANRTSLFYTVGSRLYQYDYARGYIGYHDFGAEITYLGQEYCSRGDDSEYMVATYDDTEKGKIYKMKVSTDADKVEFVFLKDQVWDTRLKVKDIEWKINGSVL